jgi:hypothetical protein
LEAALLTPLPAAALLPRPPPLFQITSVVGAGSAFIPRFLESRVVHFRVDQGFFPRPDVLRAAEAAARAGAGADEGADEAEAEAEAA